MVSVSFFFENLSIKLSYLIFVNDVHLFFKTIQKNNVLWLNLPTIFWKNDHYTKSTVNVVNSSFYMRTER